MSVPLQGQTSDSEGVGVNLSELIETHRAGRSYAELERDCGGAPTRGRLQQLVNQQIKNFPDPPTVSALARGLRVSQAAVVLAAAESLGLDVRTPLPRLVELLPAEARDLTEQQAAAIAHLVRTIVGSAVSAAPASVGEPHLEDVLRRRRALVERQGRAFSGDWVAALNDAISSGDPALQRVVPELEKRAAEQVEQLSSAKAAREGMARLRALKEAQDQAGEAPDPPSPDEGI